MSTTPARSRSFRALPVAPMFAFISALAVPDAGALRADEPSSGHWAYRPLGDPPVPEVRAAGVAGPVDRFIVASLEAAGLGLAEDASPAVLFRRLWLDMLGLPPAPEDVERFEVATAQDPDRAWRDAVDRVLASPHHGERWGRHWLDVVRYADSDGQEADGDRPNAYPYRDFVIRALNEDLPFDTFVRWQIAGDEIAPDVSQAVAATGFLAAGPSTTLADTFLEEERLRNRYNELDDIVSTTGNAMLALTVGCARCHDHKYDAISSREYYRMLAAFHSGDRAEIDLGDGAGVVLGFRDVATEARPTWLFERADFYDRDELVDLGFIDALLRGATAEDYRSRALAAAPAERRSTFQRRALAEWLTDVDRGAGALLARVIVNRIWQHHFGVGIVGTSGDFGVRGEPPSHPELLEWLARDLVRGGFRLKRVHRAILLSQTYRQSDDRREEAAAIDPANRLLWRMLPRRVEAEVLRDAMLEVSGTLDRAAFGPGFKPPIAPEAQVARNLRPPYPNDGVDGPSTWRRSVYMFHKRVVPYPLLEAFDRPDSLQSCSRRNVTTVAPQALALLNASFVRSRARDFALRLVRERHGAEERVERAFRLALGRSPSSSEASACVEFLASQKARREARGEESAALDALTDFCQAMFALNEFSVVD